MSTDDDIRILAEELTPSSSKEREKNQAEKKFKGKETSSKTLEKEHKGPQEKAKLHTNAQREKATN